MVLHVGVDSKELRLDARLKSWTWRPHTVYHVCSRKHNLRHWLPYHNPLWRATYDADSETCGAFGTSISEVYQILYRLSKGNITTVRNQTSIPSLPHT